MAVCGSFHHCECASIVEEMEWEQSELIKALEDLVALFEPGRVYQFEELSALIPAALKAATGALEKARAIA